MPVKKISDAPGNIKELDDVKLTLAQINSILRVYDALKEKGEVDNPMAVAIAQFKKANHKSDGKWVKNKKAEGASMSMVDLKNLDRYVVIRTGAQSPSEIDDLRELEGDWGHGVYPLWSDGLQSIVAFAFEPALFNADEAQAWVKKAMEKQPAAMRLIDVAKAAQSVAAALVQTFSTMLSPGLSRTPPAKTARSFDDIRLLVSHALDDQYGTIDPLGGYKEGPWILDMGPRVAIVEQKGKQYAVDYQIDENDVVTLGVMTPVDKEWTRSADGAPVMLHAFAAHLKAGDEASDDEDDDSLIWKEIIRPGKWFYADSGRLVEITAEMIQQAFEAWEAGLPKLISVPSDSHHSWNEGIVPVESNRGFVQKLKMIDDRLFGAFDLTDPNVSYGVQVGNIADVSVYLQPNVVHPDSGDTFPWVLQHVLLTNNPLVPDLEPFNAIPASGTGPGGYVVQSYQQSEDEEVTEMAVKKKGEQEQQPPEGLTLTAVEAATYQEFQALGLSVSDVKAIVAERQQVREKARGLEITQVIRALEGVETHDGVVQVEGTRHYPVICVAVEKALREHPEALALAANDGGQTGLDAVVLEIMNAIPQEGRMALSTDGQPSGDRDPKAKDPTLKGDEAEPTDEQIDDLGKRIL